MNLLNDCRFAARMLAANKGWTAVAALALALGLGANVAIFSVVGLMIWTPLPYPEADRLVFATQTSAKRGFRSAAVSLQDMKDWSAASSIATFAAYQSRPLATSGTGEPHHLRAMQVTPEFFPVLGVKPASGRTFLPSESPETESRVAVLSHEFWQGTFRGEPALGRDLRLEGRNYTIVGIMPAGFTYLYDRIDVWTPLSLEKAQRERSWRGLNTVARLKPGSTVAQAAAEVRSISERIEREDPKTGLGWRGDVRLLTERIIAAPAVAAANTMFGAVGFVLLIACANVASLLLARGMQRRREIAVRAALGASRGSLIRLQLVESVLLSAGAGVIGTVSAVWTIPLLKTIAPAQMPVLQTARLDWTAMLFGLLLSLVTGVLFGVVPGWVLSRGELSPALRESSRGFTGGRHLVLKSLVAGEIALALVLVTACTLMIRSLIRQSTIDPGFDRTNLVAGHVLLSPARYPDRKSAIAFFGQALENLRREGSVESAALVQTMPLGGNNTYLRVRVEGADDPDQDLTAGHMVVSPGYFAAMRIGLVAGRDFTDGDIATAPKVAVVNETFVKRYLPAGGSPVGRRLQMGAKDDPWTTVVGVARDVRHTGMMEPARPEVYRPHAQIGERIMMMVARGRSGTASAATAVRNAVWEVDAEQPLFRLESVEAFLSNRASGERATTQVLGVLAVIALILAAVGTYGVMAYTAAQRVREIGIRLALGASRQDVFRLLLRGGLTLAGIGLLIGLPAAWGVTPLLRALSETVDSRDSVAFGGVGVLLAAVAAVASVVPAWRATRVDPARVLRED